MSSEEIQKAKLSASNLMRVSASRLTRTIVDHRIAASSRVHNKAAFTVAAVIVHGQRVRIECSCMRLMQLRMRWCTGTRSIPETFKSSLISRLCGILCFVLVDFFRIEIPPKASLIPRFVNYTLLVSICPCTRRVIVITANCIIPETTRGNTCNCVITCSEMDTTLFQIFLSVVRRIKPITVRIQFSADNSPCSYVEVLHKSTYFSMFMTRIWRSRFLK